jgi:hypothetical protein
MPYRTGNHWGVTIVRETPIDGMTAVNAELVAVVVNGDQALAERICALLNGNCGEVYAGPAGSLHTGRACEMPRGHNGKHAVGSLGQGGASWADRP